MWCGVRLPCVWRGSLSVWRGSPVQDPLLVSVVTLSEKGPRGGNSLPRTLGHTWGMGTLPWGGSAPCWRYTDEAWVNLLRVSDYSEV